MKVVLLCGGRGYRLNEETEYRPKPMMPIGGMPILWHIMKIYAHFGHKEFILCLGYKSEVIKEFFRNYCWHKGDVTIDFSQKTKVNFHDGCDEIDWKITLAETGLRTPTAGRISKVRKYLEGQDEFLLTYGDGVGNIDLEALLEKHRAGNSILTLTAAHPPGRFGEIKVDQSGKIKRFNEKPQTEDGLINAGYMICSSSLLDVVDRYAEDMLEQGPMTELVHSGQLGCHVHEGFWQPMDTFQEFHLLTTLWESGAPPWKVW